MEGMSRRKILGAAAIGGAVAAAGTVAQAATFGNPDHPAEGSINARTPTSLTNPGPRNPGIESQFPSFQDPPPTDVDGLELFWASFNNAHKRIQNGGWAREVNQSDFAVSEAVSGVNMRLSAGGVRELHWHQQAEWAVMVDGKRVRAKSSDTPNRTRPRGAVSAKWLAARRLTSTISRA